MTSTSSVSLEERRREAIRDLDQHPHFRRLRDAISSLPPAGDFPFTLNGSPRLSVEVEDYPSQKELAPLIEELIPWRKGPLSLLGHPVETQWNSALKYDFVISHLLKVWGKDRLAQSHLLDLGCNNGYYMFRLSLEHSLGHITGFDPTPHYYLQFLLLEKLFPLPKMTYELFGWEDLRYFEDSFELVLCMGILYHHRDPIAILRRMGSSLKRDGLLVVECQTINAKGSYCLFPSKKYCGVSGSWFIPSVECLLNWIKRAGFSKAEVFEHHKLDEDEQRRSVHSPEPSLETFLDQEDPEKTIEGYPAPYRTYVSVKR